MSMALLKTSLFRGALGRLGFSTLAKSFSASLNLLDMNVSVNDGEQAMEYYGGTYTRPT